MVAWAASGHSRSARTSAILAAMRKPIHRRDNLKARRIRVPPDGVDVSAVAASCRYVGSPYHAHGPSRHRRPDASLCPADLSRDHCRVEGWLRAGVRAGRTGVWEGGFPKYVWHRHEDAVFEARQGAPGSGEYHGYPLQPEQRVRGL